MQRTPFRFIVYARYIAAKNTRNDQLAALLPGRARLKCQNARHQWALDRLAANQKS